MQRAARFTYATVALSLIGSLVVSGGSAQAATSDWTLLSPSQYPSARSQAAMTYDVATGQTLLFGGTTTTTYRSGANVADTWTWDGSNWRQLHPSVSPPPTAGAAMAYDAATRQAANSQGEVEGKCASRHRLDSQRGLVAHPHDCALTKLLFDLTECRIECLFALHRSPSFLSCVLSQRTLRKGCNNKHECNSEHSFEQASSGMNA